MADNIDLTVESDAVTLSTESDTFWQGWHYTDLKEHESAYINITAAGLYDGEPDATWRALRLFGQIESEIVDSSNNPVAGTLVTQEFSIQSPNSDGFAFGAMKKVIRPLCHLIQTTRLEPQQTRQLLSITLILSKVSAYAGEQQEHLTWSRIAQAALLTS